MSILFVLKPGIPIIDEFLAKIDSSHAQFKTVPFHFCGYTWI